MRLSPSLALLRTQSDERLVALAREGSEPAFAAIVERHRRSLVRAARRVLPESRAEDAVQQALIAAWHGLRRGDEVRDLPAWLHRITRNMALNALRVPGYDVEELRDILAGRPAPEDEIERRDAVRRALVGLAALPARQREALLRSALEGAAHADIAHDLGLSEGATRQLVLRARTKLRAAAGALLPWPLVEWLALGAGRADTSAARVAELAAGAGSAGAAAVLAKTGAVAVLAGGAVAGPAIMDRGAETPAPRATSTKPRPASAETQAPAEPAPRRMADPGSEEDGDRRGRGSRRERGREDDEDRSGRSGGSNESAEDDRDDRSGPRGGSDDAGDATDEDRSGSDSGSDDSNDADDAEDLADDLADEADDAADDAEGDSSGPG